MRIQELNAAPLTKTSLCNRLKNFQKMIRTMTQSNLSITGPKLGLQIQDLRAQKQLPAVLTMAMAAAIFLIGS
jgi:hypothetical protein